MCLADVRGEKRGRGVGGAKRTIAHSFVITLRFGSRGGCRHCKATLERTVSLQASNDTMATLQLNMVTTYPGSTNPVLDVQSFIIYGSDKCILQAISLKIQIVYKSCVILKWRITI